MSSIRRYRSLGQLQPGLTGARIMKMTELLQATWVSAAW